MPSVCLFYFVLSLLLFVFRPLSLLFYFSRDLWRFLRCLRVFSVTVVCLSSLSLVCVLMRTLTQAVSHSGCQWVTCSKTLSYILFLQSRPLKTIKGVQTNVNSQWKPVYKALHRIYFCWNEPISMNPTHSRLAWLWEWTSNGSIVFSCLFAICFCISKCRREWDVGLCTCSGLVTGMPLHSGDFQHTLRTNTFSLGISCHSWGVRAQRDA